MIGDTVFVVLLGYYSNLDSIHTTYKGAEEAAKRASWGEEYRIETRNIRE